MQLPKYTKNAVLPLRDPKPGGPRWAARLMTKGLGRSPPEG